MQKEVLPGKVGCVDPLGPSTAANWHKAPPRYLLLYELMSPDHTKQQNIRDSESKITFLNETHHVLRGGKNNLQDMKHQTADKRNPESHWPWVDFSTLKWTFIAIASTYLRTWYKSQVILTITTQSLAIFMYFFFYKILVRRNMKSVDRVYSINFVSAMLTR